MGVKKTNTECIFCSDSSINIILESKNFRSLYNISPILPGHSIVVPKKHYKKLFDIHGNQIKEMFDLIKDTTKLLMKTFKTKGFDLVLMEDKVAGQRMEHVHWHILPRKRGDMKSNPREFFFKLLENEERGRRTNLSKHQIKMIISEIKSNLK